MIFYDEFLWNILICMYIAVCTIKWIIGRLYTIGEICLISMFIYHVLCIYVINTGLNADLSSGVHGLVTILILYICTNYLFDLMMLYSMVRYSVNKNAFQIRFHLYVPPNRFMYTFVLVEMSMNILYWTTYVTFLWFFLVIYEWFMKDLFS